MNDQSVDPKVAAIFVQVLHKELSNDPAGQDILARFEKAPKENSQDLLDYLQHRLEADMEFREGLARAPELPADMRAIIYGSQVERIVQIAEAGTVIVSVGFGPFSIFRRIRKRLAGSSSTDAPPPKKKKKPKGK